MVRLLSHPAGRRSKSLRSPSAENIRWVDEGAGAGCQCEGVWWWTWENRAQPLLRGQLCLQVSQTDGAGTDDTVTKA